MQNIRILQSTVLVIVGFYFLIYGLVSSKAFLAPILTAFTLALIILPVTRKIENYLSKNLAALISTVILFLFSILFFWLCSVQIKSFINDWPSIKSTMAPEIEEFKEFIFDHTPLSKESLEEMYPEGSIPALESPLNEGARAVTFLRSVMNFIGSYLLSFIYIFFMLHYRQHFKDFLLKIFSNQRKDRLENILSQAAEVVQQYLLGRVILMGILSVLYSVGLGLSGVDNYILIGIIASILTLIPWIGNIIGLLMAMAFGYLTSGDLNVLWGIIITFTVSQFLESYVLQPFIVGDKVGLHPFFVILFVILGGAVWGLIGMVLAIPIMAMVTVIFQHVTPLKPYGFLFSKSTD